MSRLIDLTGKKFGRLAVLAHAGRSARKQTHWLCRCECGRRIVAQGGNLATGHTTSCGCWRHGLTGTPTYRTWSAMTSRCRSESNRNYPAYGARGIEVCERWRTSFTDFLADMGERPSLAYSLDRIDNDGNYEPGNCRWATRSQQRRNQREGGRGRLLEYAGARLCIKNWAERLGMDEGTLGYRIRAGWPVESALSTPVSAGRSKAGRASQQSRRKEG